MTIEEKAKAYDEAKARMSIAYNSNRCTIGFMNEIFPEFKINEDERIRKVLIDLIYKIYADTSYITCDEHEQILAWLEKQRNNGVAKGINNEITKGILRGAAIHLITWIDYNAAEGNMCLSNMECKDIEDALVNADWDKIYAYMKKKLEKQGEQKFIVDGILTATDYDKMFQNCKQGEPKETLCDKCKKEQPSHSCQAYPSQVEYSSVGDCLKDYNAEQRRIWLEGAKWADKTMIERACKFFWSLSLEKMDEYFSSSENLCQFTEDYKKAMEE